METRTWRLMAVLLATSIMIPLSGATTANANSDPTTTTTPAAAVTTGPKIEVTVTGSGYKGGSSGSGGGGSVSLTVPAPCWMVAADTGKEYYEWVHSGRMAQANHNMALNQGEYMTALPGYEAYKDDALGHWYYAYCDIDNWPVQDDLAGFITVHDRYWAEYGWQYFPVTEDPPAPPVPPELLREVAIKSLTLPDPELDWNPKIKGNDGTLVNLDTWFWLNNAPPRLDVRAQAGTSWATVTATFGGMDITAPGEAPVSCANAGTPYVTGAKNTDCIVAFSRASSALGAQASGGSGAEATPVTVKTRWTATWEGTGVGQTPITFPTKPERIVNIRVDEVQTLVKGTG